MRDGKLTSYIDDGKILWPLLWSCGDLDDLGIGQSVGVWTVRRRVWQKEFHLAGGPDQSKFCMFDSELTVIQPKERTQLTK